MIYQLILFALFVPMISGCVEHELFVSRVISFSSQWSTDSWSANKVIGPPDVYPQYGDLTNAWASQTVNNVEFIEVEFSEYLYIETIEIYETFHAGGVTGIDALNGSFYQSVYSASPVDIQQSRIFKPPIETLTFKSNRLKIHTDSTLSRSYVEIDAIKITGKDKIQCELSNMSLGKELAKLVNCDDYSDVVFLVDGNREVYAHKAILASRSEYFNNLFSNLSGDTVNVTELREAKYEEVLALLEYVYTGETSCNLSVVIYLLKMANKLCASEDLIQKCMSSIPEQLSVNNVLDFYVQSDGLDQVQDVCYEFIAVNYSKVIKSQTFASLTKEVIVKILQMTVDSLPLCADDL